MHRPLRVLMAAVVVMSLTGGGYLLRWHPAGSGGRTTGADGTRHVAGGSVLTAVQPALSPSPRRTPSPTPSSSRVTASPKPHATKTTAPASHSVVDVLLAQINDLRAQHGLPPYTLLGGLNASAHRHNLRMAGTCGMSHQCPGEASLGARISAEGVHWSACGENIGWSGPHANTASAMIHAAEGLTTSMYNEKAPNDGHRRNLLSTQFHHIGIDVIRDSSGKVWLTQDFSS